MSLFPNKCTGGRTHDENFINLTYLISSSRPYPFYIVNVTLPRHQISAIGHMVLFFE